MSLPYLEEMASYTIHCLHGDTLVVSEITLSKITYFQGILTSSYRETHERSITFPDFSVAACRNILTFYETGKIDIPISAMTVEESLGIANYWGAEKYIDEFMVSYVRSYNKTKTIEMLNLLALTGRMSKHRNHLNSKQFKETVVRAPLVHMLLPETLEMILEYTNKDKGAHLFAVTREWYLFDPQESKLSLVKKVLTSLNLEAEAMTPSHRTNTLLDKCNDPSILRIIAKILLPSS